MRNVFCFLFCLCSISLFAQQKLTICDIQGFGPQSSFDGEIVTTTGVVTANFSDSDELRGFFIQDDQCDLGRPASKGLFVFTGSSPLIVSVGDSIEITGEVSEFFNLTELSDVTELNLLATNADFQYYTIELPLARRTELENFENMMVRFEQKLYVTDHFNLSRFGELRLSSDGVRPIPTQFIDPNDVDPSGVSASGTGNVNAVRVQEELNNNNYITLDDGSTVSNPRPVPFLDSSTGTLTAGSSVENLQGVLSYSFDEYRLHPVDEVLFDYQARANRIQFNDDAPTTVSICAFNVLNYFTSLGEWGAQSSRELERQTDKIVSALAKINADVFGLMEIENNGDEAYSALLQALNDNLGEQLYRALNNETPGNFRTKNVIFYNSNTVEPVGPLFATDAVQFERPSLGQIFKPIGEDGGEFLFVANHLRFKGCNGATGLNQDQNDGQACFNQRRKQQAAALVDFIDDIQSQTGVGPAYILGDMNAYYQEDPIDLLRANGYESVMDEDEYSFVFQGEYGALDHVMANSEGMDKVYVQQILRINSSEPRFLDYAEDNLDFYQNNMYRSADHDPVIVWLSQDKLLSNAETSLRQDIPHLYPNPVQDRLFIEIPVDWNFQSMELLDLNGRTILRFEDPRNNIDLRHFPSGIYMLRMHAVDAVMSFPVVKK